jgi:hypothetical protein
MNKYFVYYSDDYDEWGLEEFEHEADAIHFIEDRIKESSEYRVRTLENYTLIEGRMKPLKTIEITTRIMTC